MDLGSILSVFGDVSDMSGQHSLVFCFGSTHRSGDIGTNSGPVSEKKDCENKKHALI